MGFSVYALILLSAWILAPDQFKEGETVNGPVIGCFICIIVLQVGEAIASWHTKTYVKRED